MSIQFFATMPNGWRGTSAIRVMHFPGGEASLVIPDDLAETPHYACVTGADFDDYVALGMWVDYVHQLGLPAKVLIPYLPAARADRGVPFGAKVYADLINSFGIEQIVTFDPHSEVAPSLYRNLKVIGSAHAIRQATIGRHGHPHDYVGVIAPDAGAVARAKAAADLMQLPLFRAEKRRDFATGKLSGFSCEELPETGRLLVVDDICDGGGTFMGLAAAIDVPRERLTLFVSHGVFSGKADQLFEHFGEIITTDSHPGARRPDVQASVLPIRNLLVPYFS